VHAAESVPELVVDSWPIMEWVKGREPAMSAFRTMIEKAIAGEILLSMSRMNHGEVIYSIRKDIPAHLQQMALAAFREIPIRLYSVDDLLVDEAVALKSVYKISFADAFGAALSLRLGLPFVTGDRELLALIVIGLQLHWVGA
jgi:predicted nucleic acid-binding protein